MPPWANGKNGKEYRATMGSKAIGGIFSVGVEEPYRWKDSVQHANEIRIWVADGIAQGLRPWFTKFNAKPFDNRWLPVVEQIYKWHHQNEAYLRNVRPLAKVAMVYSQRNAAFYGGAQARPKVEDHSLGYYHALIEARIPFEMVHDGLLDAESLKPYQVLVLPNIATLSDAQCGQLKAFVERGGSLVATHETSLYDEWGTRRADFGLGALFGAKFTGKVEERVQNSYLNVDIRNELTKGLEEAPRIINGAKWVHATPTDAAYKPALTHVPSYPDLPMEEVYPRVKRTNVPGIYARQAGRGRVVYFPFDLDRTYWEVLSPDHAALLGNAVRWAMNGPQPLEVTGPGILDIALWEQKRSLTAHLVNLTNPMLMKGPFREIYPVGEQKAVIEVPPGRKVTGVHMLTGSRKAEWTLDGNQVTVQVPGVTILEVIAVDLA
jgi:type 1 glutamine amidotransferase